MERKRSLQALLDFLEYMSKNGLMNQTTAGARRTAAAAVFSVLDESEKEDVTAVDLESVMLRFQNLQGKNFTPDSLRTYQSRLRSAINDFLRYLDNPLAFRPSVQPRERKAAPTRNVETAQEESSRDRIQGEGAKAGVASVMSNILPIPIRADLTIFIQGIPFDLSAGEAKRIAGVIQALASD